MPRSARLVLVATAALAGAAGAGAGTAAATHLFRDVPHGATHAEGVEWASSRGLVLGHPDGTFRPGDPVTRGQLATVLHRQHAWRGPVVTLTPVCGTLDLWVVDHNARVDGDLGGEASVEWSVDGGTRRPLPTPFPREGRAVVVTADRPGVVSLFVDDIAWAHAPTAQDCEPGPAAGR